MRNNLLLACLIAISGCTQTLETTTTFDPTSAAYVLEQGTNTISGQAFLRRNDGIVVYAAGSEVTILPVTSYSTDRLNQIYQGTKFSNRPAQFATTDSQYLKYTKRTVADGEGRFTFQNMADGEYYITTQVIWQAGDLTQGGSLMEQVSVKSGQSVEVIMSGK